MWLGWWLGPANLRNYLLYVLGVVIRASNFEKLPIICGWVVAKAGKIENLPIACGCGGD